MGYLGGGLNHLVLSPGTTTCANFGGSNNGVDGRHLTGANYMFCDGHVKWLLGHKVSVGYNASSATQSEGGLPDVSGRVAAGTDGVYDAGGDKPAATFSVR
jgi:prepilin-type processing-associated H-X9-DG protein